ncbi:MAG: hypothetical protein KF740_18550 [Ramlibacter sp.]|nr:hypothetical protein [Ramlibacter sp.]
MGGQVVADLQGGITPLGAGTGLPGLAADLIAPGTPAGSAGSGGSVSPPGATGPGGSASGGTSGEASRGEDRPAVGREDRRGSPVEQRQARLMRIEGAGVNTGQ